MSQRNTLSWGPRSLFPLLSFFWDASSQKEENENLPWLYGTLKVHARLPLPHCCSFLFSSGAQSPQTLARALPTIQGAMKAKGWNLFRTVSFLLPACLSLPGDTAVSTPLSRAWKELSLISFSYWFVPSTVVLAQWRMIRCSSSNSAQTVLRSFFFVFFVCVCVTET